jgi:2-polyprenyl-6-methoxyphenol hydroxylase-like FAD-dependent oxidoreductase
VGSNPTPSARSTVSRCPTAGFGVTSRPRSVPGARGPAGVASPRFPRRRPLWFSARRRGDLRRILYEASRHGTEYLFGDSIKSLEQGPDGVRDTFERAGTRTFDLVVGADGLHSNVRQLAFGDESHFIRELGYIFRSSVRPI